MTHLRSSIALTALFAASPALADVPRVITDIAPVHSLVERVMAGVGTADVLLPPGASPHDFALRPSDAGRLSDADLVVWVGEGLTPWLAEPLATLATNATTLELLESEGWTRLPMRTDDAFAHDHGEADHGHSHDDDGHSHDDGDHDHVHDHAHGDDDHAHDDQAADDHAGHDHAVHDHDHEGTDPHAWLNPDVAAAWLTHIAEALATADPENAEAYRANAIAGQAEYKALATEIEAQVAPLQGQTFVVPHDAYQYLEMRFGLPASGAITLTDAQTPGPARIAALRDRISAESIDCILTDPQVSADWTSVLRDGGAAKTALVDPDGGSQERGPDLYPALMRDIASGLADCLN